MVIGGQDMRKYQRAIAKARMKACGVANVNRKMSKKNDDGETLWRSFLWGKYAKQGELALVPFKTKRKVRKIAPITG
jgi:hypothetical protein